jgi:long-chain acyl-CoA synthetase
MSAMTIPRLFLDQLTHRADRVTLHVHRQGEWHALSWQQIADDVFRLAAVLREAGVGRGDRVVQFSENRLEWILADLAIHLLGAIHVPIHSSLTGAQAALQVKHSGAAIVLVSNPELTAKLAEVAKDLPAALQLFSYEAVDREVSFSLDDLWSRVQNVDSQAHREAIIAAAEQVTSDEPATILYTSGTTGQPKGVVLSQGNLSSNALATRLAINVDEDDLALNFLPLSHVFARTCDLYVWLCSRSQLALARSRETVIPDCAALRPTVLCGVPYFYDKVRRYLTDSEQTDKPDGLRQLLGGRIRFCCSGGAALPDHVFDFFAARDVPLLQGYGLSETSPVISASTEQQVRRGASGCAVDGVTVRIADDGEILTKGPHVMLGYYKDPEETSRVVRDGWLHTGDLGRVDEDGFVYITGRKKEILVTSGGKNILPVQLETLLTEDPLILQAVVIGDGRDYLTALIVPDWEVLSGEIARLGIHVDPPEQTRVHPEVVELVGQRIRQRLSIVSHYEQVQRFTLLPRAFSIESGELTPKLSLRRKVIEASYAHQIEQMYRR